RLVAVADVSVAFEKMPVPPWKAAAVTMPEKVPDAAEIPLVTKSEVAVAFPRTVGPETLSEVWVACPPTRLPMFAVASVDEPETESAVVVTPVAVRLPVLKFDD